MKILYKCADFIVIIGFFLFCFLTLISLVSITGVPAGQENADSLIRSFEQSAHFIDDYIVRNQKLPSHRDFGEWTSSQAKTMRWTQNIELLDVSDVPTELLNEFGPAPAQGYALIFRKLDRWNFIGDPEIKQYFLSWARDQGKNDQYPNEYVVLLILSCVFAGISYALWSLSKRVIRVRIAKLEASERKA